MGKRELGETCRSTSGVSSDPSSCRLQKRARVMPLNFSAQSFFTTTSRMFYRCKKWCDVSTKMHLRSRFKQFQTGQNRRKRTLGNIVIGSRVMRIFIPNRHPMNQKTFLISPINHFTRNWIKRIKVNLSRCANVRSGFTTRPLSTPAAATGFSFVSSLVHENV